MNSSNPIESENLTPKDGKSFKALLNEADPWFEVTKRARGGKEDYPVEQIHFKDITDFTFYLQSVGTLVHYSWGIEVNGEMKVLKMLTDFNNKKNFHRLSMNFYLMYALSTSEFDIEEFNKKLVYLQGALVSFSWHVSKTYNKLD